jgi:putative hydrolase of the HAD superfamily
MVKAEINNIIFDLGGVILNIDYHLTIQAFQRLGIPNFQELYTQANQNNIFDDFETGKISSDAFLSYVKEQSGININTNQIIEAWNAMLLDLPKTRLDQLNILKSDFKLYLLSNTNEIHVEAFKKIIATSFGSYWFEDVFEKVYFSNEIGLRKPNTEIFDFVLEQNSLAKSETIFFDDSIQHIEGAKNSGIESFLITKDKPFSYYLSSFLS